MHSGIGSHSYSRWQPSFATTTTTQKLNIWIILTFRCALMQTYVLWCVLIQADWLLHALKNEICQLFHTQLTNKQSNTQTQKQTHTKQTLLQLEPFMFLHCRCTKVFLVIILFVTLVHRICNIFCSKQFVCIILRMANWCFVLWSVCELKVIASKMWIRPKESILPNALW